MRHGVPLECHLSDHAHGGVAIFVLDDLRSSFIPVDLKPYTTELSLECCAVELVTNKAIFITLYRTEII
ncbi:unnamed protein product [Acanthoscelides obtectus]|uniref:Uncharacterized protein n=1 Tax=Acanthoscelides obtectus TaxID=200917 RepID=A0A9P0PTA8_ACAOB|nr:unnamed protein product [Acanthoscelides obtectus]CAK1627153.1 hypothetical protein AOBTE_LOCUS4343 [Acanthoscelides obtectus]